MLTLVVVLALLGFAAAYGLRLKNNKKHRHTQQRDTPIDQENPFK